MPLKQVILPVTRSVTLGHFGGAWEVELALWLLGNGAKIDQKWAS